MYVFWQIIDQSVYPLSRGLKVYFSLSLADSSWHMVLEPRVEAEHFYLPFVFHKISSWWHHTMPLRGKEKLACVASVSVWFQSKQRGTRVKDRAKNGASERAGRGWLSFHFSRCHIRKCPSSVFLCSETKKNSRIDLRELVLWCWTVYLNFLSRWGSLSLNLKSSKFSWRFFQKTDDYIDVPRYKQWKCYNIVHISFIFLSATNIIQHLALK